MNSPVHEYVQQRLSRLKESMIEKGIDAAFIIKPENVFYYSNFNPVLNSHPAIMLVKLEGTAQGESTLLIHAIRHDHARDEGAIDNIALYGKWGSHKTLSMDPVEAASKILGKVETLGIEEENISYRYFTRLTQALGCSKTVDISGLIKSEKLIKDDHEISCMRIAAKLVDIGVETAIVEIARGANEIEACTEGQYAMRKLWQTRYPEHEISGFGTSEGGMIDSLDMWSLSNERIAYGCDCPRAYTPKKGDVVLPMAWAKVSGYHAENERTVIMDSLSEERDRAYRAMLAARAEVFSILKPGTLYEDLYNAAAAVFTEYGFEEILPGRIGHGIGNSGHDYPSLARGNTIPLQKNMALTVEPGLMTDTLGGMRHSDSVIITEEGYESLTELPNGTIRIADGTVEYL